MYVKSIKRTLCFTIGYIIHYNTHVMDGCYHSGFHFSHWYFIHYFNQPKPSIDSCEYHLSRMSHWLSPLLDFNFTVIHMGPDVRLPSGYFLPFSTQLTTLGAIWRELVVAFCCSWWLSDCQPFCASPITNFMCSLSRPPPIYASFVALNHRDWA